MSSIKLILLKKLVSLSPEGELVPQSSTISIAYLKHSAGYINVRIAGVLYMLHHVIIALRDNSWPLHLVDHKDGDRSNNKPDNLRQCTRTENNCNRSMRSDNTLGYIGIYERWNKAKTKQTFGWNIKYLGMSVSKTGYNSPKEAYEARLIQLKKIHGEFAYIPVES